MKNEFVIKVPGKPQFVAEPVVAKSNCWLCKGYGWSKNHSGSRGEPEEIECGECRGSGKVAA